MPEEVRGFVRQDCQWINSLVGETSSTGSIISSMVIVPNSHDYAYMGQYNRWKYQPASETQDIPMINTY